MKRYHNRRKFKKFINKLVRTGWLHYYVCDMTRFRRAYISFKWSAIPENPFPIERGRVDTSKVFARNMEKVYLEEQQQKAAGTYRTYFAWVEPEPEDMWMYEKRPYRRSRQKRKRRADKEDPRNIHPRGLK